MKNLLSIIVVGVVLVGGVLLLARGNAGNAPTAADGSALMDTVGSQIISIRAKGGYSPRVTTAKANVASVIRVTTQGTFDCSSAITIPALGYRANLPPSGITEIPVPPQAPGTELRGLCAMGMYNFTVRFN